MVMVIVKDIIEYIIKDVVEVSIVIKVGFVVIRIDICVIILVVGSVFLSIC